ncbi:tetratricopeptide repeat protein, partial [Streptomyces sp. NPDC127077]|uniref:tetratricopeptide repeat protein n=1 Tax=Streptomyces sp. NPDC127077 TaxID=3347131 RepID=UPI00364CF217
AIPLYEATLTQREQILGDTHPDTLASRNNLANAYQSAGDLGRAIPLHEATLTQYEQVLGDTHPDTLASRNNLASTYQSAGDLGRAIPLHEATLTQYEQVLGDTHPHTLTSRNNLANAYQAAGDLGRAIPLYEATLTQYEQVLGDTHPLTLASRNNLANAYQAAGDLDPTAPENDISAQIIQLVEHAKPYLSAAASAYGTAVFNRAEAAAVNAAAAATADLGRRVLRAVWRRRDEAGQSELERVVSEAAEEEDESYTAAVLGRLLRRTLRDDAELRAELSAMLPTLVAGSVTVMASGERSIAAQHIGTAITGDGHTAPRL